MTIPDPRHHWPFVEGSGTLATDIAMGAKVTMSRESWGPGRWSRALRFHPSEGVLFVNTTFQDREPPWTAAMWVRREADAGSAALFSSKSFALKLEQYDGQHSVGVTRFGHYDLSSAYRLPLDEWVHLVFVATERDLTVFADGEQQVKWIQPSVSLPLQWIGSTEGYTDFGAFSLEELKIYHEALTAEQVAELYGQPQRPVTFIEGVVNPCAAVTHIAGETISLGSTSGSFRLQPSDRVLLVQMSGASVDRSSSDPDEYGRITDLGRAGHYEWGVVSAAGSATVTLAQPIDDGRLDPRTGRVQLVRAYQTAEDVIVKGKVQAVPWNGEIGGVIAIITEGRLILGADVDASGQGFPGGLADGDGPAWDAGMGMRLACAQESRSAGLKGAGVAAIEANGGAGRGAVANGGGGGNPFVGGGGGGGHAGPGGSGTSYITERNRGGAGGRSLPVSDASRIFMGGGGGGGALSSQPQPGISGRGGAGGGIVIVRAHGVVGSSESGIRANGSDAETAYDGAGGGGAGGALVLVAQEVKGAFALEAMGGHGACNHSYASGDGAGGGGGGGVIRASALPLSLMSWSVEGGKGGRNASAASDGGAGDMVTLELEPLPLSHTNPIDVDVASGAGKRREDERVDGPLNESPQRPAGETAQAS